MQLLQQSSNAQALIFKMFDSADHVSAKTGLSPTVTIRKEGGSFASPSGSVTEIANGYYQVAGNATDTNTVGALVLYATASGADPADMGFQVVAWNPLLANLPANVTQFGGTNLTAASGIPEVKVASIAANAITATSIAADAITDAKVASDVTIASVTGAVGSVTGAVGSVTGAVGSIGTGGIAAASFAASAIDATALAANAITAAKIATGAITNTKFAAGAIDASAIAADAITAAKLATDAGTEIATAVRDISNASPAASSLGAAVNSAASAGDPWSTALPGAYSAGSAGFLVGTYVNASLSAVKAKTDLIPASPAAVSDIPTATENALAFLKYDMTGITGEASRSPLNTFRFIRNGFSITGSTMSILKEDDATPAYTRTLTTDAAASPVTGVS